MVCRLGTLCVSCAVGSRLPLGNADPGDGDPRRRIIRRKSVDQALDYLFFVQALDYFFFVDGRGRFNVSQRQDSCRAFAPSAPQCP